MQSRFCKFLAGYYNSSNRSTGDKLTFTIDSSHANFCFKTWANSLVLRLSSCSAASIRNRTLTLLQWALASPPADTSTWRAREVQRERQRLIVAGCSSLLCCPSPNHKLPPSGGMLYHTCLLQDRKKRLLRKDKSGFSTQCCTMYKYS